MVRRALDRAGFLRDHGDGRLAPGLFVDRGAGLAGQLDAWQNAEIAAKFGFVKWQRLDRGPLLIGHGTDLVVDTGDWQLAVIPLQASENAVERDGRVGERSAGHAAVHRQRRRLDFDQHRHDAAERIGDARQADFEIFGIADDDHVGFDFVPVALEEFHQVLGADLFLAFDDHFDIDRQTALGIQARGDRPKLGGDSALVVGGAASE